MWFSNLPLLGKALMLHCPRHVNKDSVNVRNIVHHYAKSLIFGVRMIDEPFFPTDLPFPVGFALNDIVSN